MIYINESLQFKKLYNKINMNTIKRKFKSFFLGNTRKGYSNSVK